MINVEMSVFSTYASRRVDLCQSFATSQIASVWSHAHREGLIRFDTCGGATEGWEHNPRWQLLIESSSSVVLSVMQPCVKFIDGTDHYPCAIGFRVLAQVLEQVHLYGWSLAA